MRQKGLTLIELLVAMVITGLLSAGVYRTFIGQQHTYEVQDQVVDMQQNVRTAISRMTRELRMAGFGKMGATFFGGGGMHGAFQNAVNPGGGGTSVTVVAGYQSVTALAANAPTGSNTIQVDSVAGLDTGGRKYISINGMESVRIKTITGANPPYQIELFNAENLTVDHFAGEPIFLVMAITYSIGMFEGKSCLLRDDNLGAGPQPVAENIENLQFAYFDASGNPTATPPDIRVIQLTIVARTDRTDPQLAKVGDGFRRRTLRSNIQLRNLLFL